MPISSCQVASWRTSPWSAKTSTAEWNPDDSVSRISPSKSKMSASSAPVVTGRFCTFPGSRPSCFTLAYRTANVLCSDRQGEPNAHSHSHSIHRGRARRSRGLLVGVAGCNSRYGASLDRADDPVVLTGADVPLLEGTSPQHIVGFSWDGSAWHQIPVQVDERDLVSPGEIYHLPVANYPKLYGTSTRLQDPRLHATGVDHGGVLVDPHVHPVGLQPELRQQRRAELPRVRHRQGRRRGSRVTPAGVDPATRQVVTATDPLNPGHSGAVYLFHSDTLTGGSAGTTGVAYTFSLDSGAYKATYHMGTPSLSPNNSWDFNPEHSTVVTPNYSQACRIGG